MKGFAALTTILIITSIALLLGLTISYLSIGELILGLDRHSSSQSRYLANICAEQALMDLKKGMDYQERTIEIENESCKIAIEKEDNWVIKVTSDFEKQVKKVKINISQIHPKIIIESWQEVADF